MRWTIACVISLCGCASAAPPAPECPACPAAPACQAEPDPQAHVEEAAPETDTVNIDLPRATDGDIERPILVVTLTADGRCFFAARALDSCDDLTDQARRALAADPQARVAVQADRSVTHGVVIHAIDRLKQGGITRFAFAVKASP